MNTPNVLRQVLALLDGDQLREAWGLLAPIAASKLDQPRVLTLVRELQGRILARGLDLAA